MLTPLERNSNNQRRRGSVKLATVIVGVAELVRTVVILVGNIAIYAKSAPAVQQAEIFGLMVVLLGSIAITATVGLMIFGVKRERSVYLLPQLITQTFVIGFYFYLFIRNMAYLGVFGESSWFFIVFDAFVVAFEILFAYIVVKCYKLIKIREQRMAIQSIPVQYIVPPPSYSASSYAPADLQEQRIVYQPNVLSVPPPLYDNVVMNKSKFGTLVSSQNDKLYS